MTKRIIPYVLAAMALIAGVASLHQYNVTWDEALGDLFFGQRYFSFFTSFDRRYLDFRPTLAIFDRASGRERSRIADAQTPPADGVPAKAANAGKDRAG